MSLIVLLRILTILTFDQLVDHAQRNGELSKLCTTSFTRDSKVLWDYIFCFCPNIDEKNLIFVDATMSDGHSQLQLLFQVSKLIAVFTGM